MINYIIRRALYALPILVGVNLLVFALFFVVNTPDDIARMQLGAKYEDAAAVERWKTSLGYQLPLFYNADSTGMARFTRTIFYTKSVRLFVFDFGRSDSGRDIGYDISQRMWPSLALAVPILSIGLLINISLALLLALFRASRLDRIAVLCCVLLMSVSGLFYIIYGQFVFSRLLRLVPISGFAAGLASLKFLILPILISVLSGMGAGTRWYRTIFLEEIGKDYVRTARTRGVSEPGILYKHVLGNALIPILTGVVVLIPLLFMGSLITESFFGIPGLGSYTIEAIQRQDFAILRSMVFLGSVLYIIGLLLTDLSYALVDPRVRLGEA